MILYLIYSVSYDASFLLTLRNNKIKMGATISSMFSKKTNTTANLNNKNSATLNSATLCEWILSFVGYSNTQFRQVEENVQAISTSISSTSITEPLVQYSLNNENQTRKRLSKNSQEVRNKNVVRNHHEMLNKYKRGGANSEGQYEKKNHSKSVQYHKAASNNNIDNEGKLSGRQSDECLKIQIQENISSSTLDQETHFRKIKNNIYKFQNKDNYKGKNELRILSANSNINDLSKNVNRIATEAIKFEENISNHYNTSDENNEFTVVNYRKPKSVKSTHKNQSYSHRGYHIQKTQSRYVSNTKSSPLYDRYIPSSHSVKRQTNKNQTQVITNKTLDVQKYNQITPSKSYSAAVATRHDDANMKNNDSCALNKEVIAKEKMCQNELMDYEENETLENINKELPTETMDYEDFELPRNNAEKTQSIAPTNQKNAPKENECKILDISNCFKDFRCKPEDFGVKRNSIDYINCLMEIARSLEEPVKKFSGVNYSIDYYTLDEKLAKLVNELDKTKSVGFPELFESKKQIISYIKELHKILDSNVVED